MTCVAAACLSRALLQVASVSRCGSMAFREMCSVEDPKALLERLVEYAQPALEGALLQIPGLQRVRLLDLIVVRPRLLAKLMPRHPRRRRLLQWSKRSRRRSPSPLLLRTT